MMADEDQMGPLLRTSPGRTFVHRDQAVLLLAVGRAGRRIPLQLKLRQLSVLSTDGLKDLPSFLLERENIGRQALHQELEAFLSQRSGIVHLEHNEDPVEVHATETVVTGEPDAINIGQGWLPGEYEIIAYSAETKRALARHRLFIVDDVACVLHGLNRMSLRYSVCDEPRECFYLDELVAGVVARRRSILYERGRDSIAYASHCPTKLEISARYDHVALQLEELLSCAEQFVLLFGQISLEVRTVDGNIEFEAVAHSEQYFHDRTRLENLMFRSSSIFDLDPPRLALGDRTVEVTHAFVT